MPIYKLLRRVIQGETLEKPLIIPMVYGASAKLMNNSLKEYLSKGEVLAASQLSAAREFNYDGVFIYGDNCVEAEALGGKLSWPKEFYPRVIEFPLEMPEDLEAFSLHNTAEIGRRKELLKACRILRKEAKSEKLVIGSVMGPMSVASQLLGLEKLLYLALDEPKRFAKFLDHTSILSGQYAEALASAGADILVLYEPASSPAVITKQIFMTHLVPRYQSLITDWSKLGVLVWLHILGPLKAFINELPDIKSDLLTIDDSVSWNQVRQILTHTVLVGNLHAVDFAVQPTSQIELKAKKMWEESGSMYCIMGTDCEIPLDTKPENLREMIAALRKS